MDTLKYRIGITGATGFVGRSLARSAITQGWEVHAFSRTPTGIVGVIEHFWDAGIEMTTDQTIDFSSLRLDAVIHCAAKTNDWGDYQDFDNINVLGTQRALSISPQARFIYLSTASVYVNDSQEGSLAPIDIDPSAQLLRSSRYAYTKLLGEKLSLADNRSAGTIIIRPHIVYGPGDTTLLPRVLDRTTIKQDTARLIIPGGGNGFHSVTSITTLTDFLLFAVTVSSERLSHHGKIFNIADSVPVTLSQKIKEVIKEETGVSEVKIRSVPIKLSLSIAYLCELLHKNLLKNKRPILTTYMVKELTEDTVLDLAKTQHLLYS